MNAIQKRAIELALRHISEAVDGLTPDVVEVCDAVVDALKDSHANASYRRARAELAINFALGYIKGRQENKNTL